MITISLDSIYGIEVDVENAEVIVHGCDCMDTLTDRKKIKLLRDALTALLGDEE